MSEGRLPHSVNTRKAVTRGALYSGTVGAAELTRLADVLDAAEGDSVSASLRFGRDDEERQVVAVTTAATVALECQRCLERFEQRIESESHLAIVRSDDEARQVPARYEPVLLGDEADLWAIVEEELALALPVAPMHAPENCAAALPTGSDVADSARDASAEGGERENPFGVLSQLLEDGDDEPGEPGT